MTTPSADHEPRDTAADGGGDESESLCRLAPDAARRAAPAFARAGWTYGGFTGPQFHPDAADLAVTVDRLVASVRQEEGDRNVGSGRFNVARFYEDGEECWSVTLEVASYARPADSNPAKGDSPEPSSEVSS